MQRASAQQREQHTSRVSSPVMRLLTSTGAVAAPTDQAAAEKEHPAGDVEPVIEAIHLVSGLTRYCKDRAAIGLSMSSDDAVATVPSITISIMIAWRRGCDEIGSRRGYATDAARPRESFTRQKDTANKFGP